MTRIVQIANFVAPQSGGIRTVLTHLAEGYAEAGHEVVQLLPGAASEHRRAAWGARETIGGVSLPGTGYRVMRPAAVIRALERLRPDRVEVHDRATLRRVGAWCAARGVPALAVSHERLDRLVQQWMPRCPGAAVRLAAWHDAGLVAAFDSIVCTTGWAAAEFVHFEAAQVSIVPLGVDLNAFAPAVRTGAEPDIDPPLRLMTASRLSPEKRPDLVIAAVRELLERGHRVSLTVAGDGPLRAGLERAAAGLPVTFLGHIAARDTVAALLAGADAVLAPGPVETFGLAALEALACGTPVVCNARSALPDVVGSAGIAAASSGRGFADAVERLLDRPEPRRRADARARAEQFPWKSTVAGFLTVHGLTAADTDLLVPGVSG